MNVPERVVLKVYVAESSSGSGKETSGADVLERGE
jgi:hypothetical protein